MRRKEGSVSLALGTPSAGHECSAASGKIVVFSLTGVVAAWCDLALLPMMSLL